jgi:hypothetical protein
VFVYGLVLDPTTRRIDDLRNELAGIVDDPSITLPAYCSVTIPLLGTPFFYDCLDAGRLLPSTRVRDLDGTTVSLQPLDPLPDVAAFVRAVQSFDGLRARVLRHRRVPRPLRTRSGRISSRSPRRGGSALHGRRRHRDDRLGTGRSAPTSARPRCSTRSIVPHCRSRRGGRHSRL